MIDLVESIGPWTWLFIGLLCALIDIFAGSFYLLFVGLAIATNALWDVLGLGGVAQMFLTSCCLIVYCILARRLIGNRGPSMLDEHTQVEGCTGHVLWIDPDDQCKGRGAVAERGEWLIRGVDQPLQEKSPFLVVDVEGMTLVVIQEDSQTPDS
jgi:membrane protein implicated in regulation of membrane protease activity